MPTPQPASRSHVPRVALAVIVSVAPLAVSCGRSDPTRAPPPSLAASSPLPASAQRDASTAASASVEARTPLPAPRAPAWIEFDGPPFVTETPMHGGPAWRFTTPKLPARARSLGTVILGWVDERGLSSVPNLSLRFVSEATARADRTVVLLEAKEFDAALANADKARAFAALGDVVRARVTKMNADLDARADLAALAQCTVEPSNPHADWPPCGATQTLTCGDMKLRYLGGRQTLETPKGRRSFPSWKHPNVGAGNGPRDVKVNECIADAWVDTAPGAALLVANVANLCAVPGDWCSAESQWRFVKLGD